MAGEESHFLFVGAYRVPIRILAVRTG